MMRYELQNNFHRRRLWFLHHRVDYDQVRLFGAHVAAHPGGVAEEKKKSAMMMMRMMMMMKMMMRIVLGGVGVQGRN